jgi:hypothetical protein
MGLGLSLFGIDGRRIAAFRTDYKPAGHGQGKSLPAAGGFQLSVLVESSR